MTSAVESFDDDVLAQLDKGHTRADFARRWRAVASLGLALSPTFVAFTPWTTLDGYARNLLEYVARSACVRHVAPVQWGIRLLVHAGSRLLELPDLQAIAGPFNQAALVHPLDAPGPRRRCAAGGRRTAVAADVAGGRLSPRGLRCGLHAGGAGGPQAARHLPTDSPRRARATIPYLTEPWFC